MKMSANEAMKLADEEAANIIIELRDELPVMTISELANIKGALQIAFMRGMAHTAKGIGDELRSGLTKTDPKGRHS